MRHNRSLPGMFEHVAAAEAEPHVDDDGVITTVPAFFDLDMRPAAHRSQYLGITFSSGLGARSRFAVE
jgi:hypothetical protein